MPHDDSGHICDIKSSLGEFVMFLEIFDLINVDRLLVLQQHRVRKVQN